MKNTQRLCFREQTPQTAGIDKDSQDWRRAFTKSQEKELHSTSFLSHFSLRLPPTIRDKTPRYRRDLAEGDYFARSRRDGRDWIFACGRRELGDVHANAHHRAIPGGSQGKRWTSILARGSWQSLLVVTPLFAAAEMRRQMTETGARVRARLRPFVAEFLSDVQLSLRFNSLSSTGGICVTRNSPVFYFRLNRPAQGLKFCAQ